MRSKCVVPVLSVVCVDLSRFVEKCRYQRKSSPLPLSLRSFLPFEEVLEKIE